jgi:hypothetical protein
VSEEVLSILWINGKNYEITLIESIIETPYGQTPINSFPSSSQEPEIAERG